MANDVQIYLAFRDARFGAGTLLVRTTGDPMAVVPALKTVVWTQDANLPIRNISRATDAIAEALAPSRFNLVLLALFALLGVALAVVGVYGCPHDG